MLKKYKVIDGSYALTDSGGEMKPISGAALKGNTFIMLAKDCSLPTPHGNINPHISKTNNVILRNCETDQIVFTQLRFIRPLIAYCPVCGQEIQKEANDERM